MEFAAVNSSKAAAKTVAITLTNEEARNPANAFAALLNLSGNVRFNAEGSLTQAEGQWMRAQANRDQDAAKPKADNDVKPKDKAEAADKPADENHDDDVSASAKSETTDETSNTEGKGVAAAGETQPAEQTAAVGLEAIQTVAIQFQILVQLPNGSLQDMGTFDLKSLLAAASQDSALASALEAAFGQAAESLSQGQALLGDLTQNLTTNPALAAALAQTGEVAVDATDASAVSELFKQIAAAFRPLAQQASAATKTDQSAQTAQSVNLGVQSADASLELQSPEAARQSAELSKIFGEDNKIRIQVAVDGRKVADVPFEWSAFNKFAGYNPEAMRTMSTANGQAGQGQATNALTEGAPAPQANAMAQNAALQSNLGSQQNAGQMPRGEIAQVRAPEAPTPANNNSNSTQSQSSSFANALSQAGGNNATTNTQAAERPAPTQPQQVIEQIKVNITRAAKAGLDRVTIQLRPEELGRIEIKLELTQDGQVRANVTADNPATLELLQREARGLERALQDAGLNAEASDLEFNLRSENHDRRADERDAQGQPGRGQQGQASRLNADNENDEAFDYERAALLRGGVDTYA
jgi:flagellar hook-length control protein FliK